MNALKQLLAILTLALGGLLVVGGGGCALFMTANLVSSPVRTGNIGPILGMAGIGVMVAAGGGLLFYFSKVLWQSTEKRGDERNHE